MKELISENRKQFLAKKNKRKILIILTQFFILVGFIILWEVLANAKILNEFITSKPSRIINTVLAYQTNHLLLHLWVTVYETILGFLLGTFVGVILASFLWWSPFASKVCEPFLIVLHSLPKVALGPIIIVWAGAGTNAIIMMALAISLIVTILEMLNGFLATDKNLIKLANTFHASKWQIYSKIVFPSNVATLVNAMKVNIGLSLVGVISGEFLVSKAGLRLSNCLWRSSF